MLTDLSLPRRSHQVTDNTVHFVENEETKKSSLHSFLGFVFSLCSPMHNSCGAASACGIILIPLLLYQRRLLTVAKNIKLHSDLYY